MTKSINFDPTDLRSMCDLMDRYGDSSHMFSGSNVEDEDVFISISSENIVVKTYQENGWVRKNVYDRDGTVEELFEGRWK